MKQKHLESHLSSMPHRTFVHPKVELEQYPTSVTLTASIALMLQSKGDAGPGITALDLGCGTGILGLALALVGCPVVWLVDCDDEALRLARENVEYWEQQQQQTLEGCSHCALEIVKARVRNHHSITREEKNDVPLSQRGRRSYGRGRVSTRGSSSLSSDTARRQEAIRCMRQTDHCSNHNNCMILSDGVPLPSNMVDTVITNPPFGTKNNNCGIDIAFLLTSLRLARRSVYSFHKTSTRQYLFKEIQKWEGVEGEVVAEMKFDIGKMYKFHIDKTRDVEVDLIRLFWRDKDGSCESD